jgi:hypothetical protein
MLDPLKTIIPIGMDSTELHNFLSAADFWMGVEALTPNPAPPCRDQASKGILCWDIQKEEELPWRAPAKIKRMHQVLESRKQAIKARAKAGKAKEPDLTWRYAIYAGITPMEPVMPLLQKMLGVEEADVSEFRPGKPAATLALMLEKDGRVVADRIFVSSMPWAVRQVQDAQPGGPLDFTGFAGTGGYAELLTEKIKQFMTRRGLLAPDQDAAAYDTPASAGQAPAPDTRSPARPVALDDVQAIVDFMFAEIGWRPPQIAALTRFQARVVSERKIKDGKDGDIGLLNSFYLDDIESVTAAARDGRVGPALQDFVRARMQADRIDIRRDGGAFQRQALLPNAFPLGCWPSAHPLVYNQQFAVNNIMQELGDSAGIFSVNGPPGTGKTTLLRDIVAGVVVERARVLAQFSNPAEQAFGHEIEIDWDFKNARVYRLNPRLCKRGIVVVSANNGAVENVTRELPGIGAIDSTLRYLQPLSETLASSDEGGNRPEEAVTWGAIAGVMGKSDNRKQFFGRFAKRASGDVAESLANGDPMSLWMLMALAKGSNPWPAARQRFQQALDRALKARARMDAIAGWLRQRDALAGAITAQTQDMRHSRQRLEQARARAQQQGALASAAQRDYDQLLLRHTYATAWQRAAHKLAALAQDMASGPYRDLTGALQLAAAAEERAESALRTARSLLSSEQAMKPDWLRRLFRFGARRDWEQSMQTRQAALAAAELHKASAHRQLADCRARDTAWRALQAAQAGAQGELDAASQLCRQQGVDPDQESMQAWGAAPPSGQALQAARAAARLSTAELAQCEQGAASASAACMASQSLLQQCLAQLRDAGVDDAAADQWLGTPDTTEEQLQLSAPWFDAEFFAARKALFEAAMQLQESFIVNTWEKLKHILMAVDMLATGALSPQNIQACPGELWDAFFMVVPVVSTTFASFPRMFEGWAPESIGWLLIDESGQATPQQAIGAIWRSQRVVVVGDPLQLEPVVPLPQELLTSLRERCGARKEYHPVMYSVQVLADMANRIGTVIGDDGSGQWVGSPLRVHRRCLDPMFRIANDIAYDGMMVYGTLAQDDGAWAGESTWFHLAAGVDEAEGNCIPSQVDLALAIVKKISANMNGITDEDGKSRIYLITPFRDVNDALGAKLRAMPGETDGMHGTVHTFQGKEADVVIFVLGADPKRPGVIAHFAAARPNLLNVALTRARKRVYIVGDHDLWSRYQFFDTLAAALPRRNIRRD